MRPLETIADPCPVDRSDPIEAIVRSAAFSVAQGYFAAYPANSLLHNGGVSRAFIFLLIRSLGLRRALEIGTYQAGTTEVIARAIQANDGERVDTVDPSGGPYVEATMAKWPQPMSAISRFHLLTSMQFFPLAMRERWSYDFIFVDGDHDLEAASFDIRRAAEIIEPGGIMLIDNVDQPGVREAALRFLGDNPHWQLLGSRSSEMLKQPSIMPFEEAAMSVEGTCFWCLRAPQAISLTPRLTCFPNVPFPGDAIYGLLLKSPQRPSSGGRLRYKIYLRALPKSYDDGLTPLEYNATGEAALSQMERSDQGLVLRLPQPLLQLRGLPDPSKYSNCTEMFLSYSSEVPLLLSAAPLPLADPA